MILNKKKPAAFYFPPEWSIIDVRVLDFRVRNGNGYCHPTMATGILYTVIIYKKELFSFLRRRIASFQGGRKIWPGLTTY